MTKPAEGMSAFEYEQVMTNYFKKKKTIEYNGKLVTHPEGAGRNPGECDIFVGYQHGDKTKPIMSIRYMTLEGQMVAMNLQMEGDITDIRNSQLDSLPLKNKL